MKICNICRFKSRDSEEFDTHAVKSCSKCGKEVLERKLKKQMNAHQIEQGYSKVVCQGKIKASKVKATSDEPKDIKPPTAYRVFHEANN